LGRTTFGLGCRRTCSSRAIVSDQGIQQPAFEAQDALNVWLRSTATRPCRSPESVRWPCLRMAARPPRLIFTAERKFEIGTLSEGGRRPSRYGLSAGESSDEMDKGIYTAEFAITVPLLSGHSRLVISGREGVKAGCEIRRLGSIGRRPLPVPRRRGTSLVTEIPRASVGSVMRPTLFCSFISISTELLVLPLL